MLLVAKIIHLAFSIYALGLIVWAVLSWVHLPPLQNIRSNLDKFYIPFLTQIQAYIKPVDLSGRKLDLSPAILLVIVLVLRWVIVMLVMAPF